MGERTVQARLDEEAAVVGGDPRGMLGLVASAGRQAGDALAALDLGALTGPRPEQVVVAGMCGDGTAGDLLAALAYPDSPVPVLTCRQDRLPAFVGPGTLVIAASYAGDTEEIVTATRQAGRAGARVVAVTTGGPLAETAGEVGAVVVTVPGGRPPRAALWTMAVPVLAAAEACGVVSGVLAQVEAATAALDSENGLLGPTVPSHTNPAKLAALRLAGKLPVAWGTGVLGAVAAARFRTQCNENAKVSVVHAAVPEANHNDVMALEGGLGDARELVLLRDDEGEHPRDRVRLQAVLAALGMHPSGAHGAGANFDGPVLRTAGQGGDLVRFARLAAFADYTSVYLGMLRGVDPLTIGTIDRVKAGVAARGGR